MIIEVEADVTLKDCPFCGGGAVLKAETDFFVQGGTFKTSNKIARYWVKCTNDKCAASPLAQSTQTAAIDAWNRRA
jgi:Lar family restriction alleviation protein